MKPIERLFQYLEYKGIRPTRFERENGLSNGYLALTLKRKGDIGSQIVEKILNNCPDLSQEWLMLGSGQMLKNQRRSTIKDKKGLKATFCPLKCALRGKKSSILWLTFEYSIR